MKNDSPRELFDQIVAANRDLRVERTADGEVIVMGPAYTRIGFLNSIMSSELGMWAEGNKTGFAFDSSAGFDLPNGANRSPDTSWVLKSRVLALTPEERNGYFPLCPDFVIELRSDSDRISVLKSKMEEYIENGARLGWLIDPIKRAIFVYRPGVVTQQLDAPFSISGDPELPGFTLSLEEIWNPAY